MQAVDAKPENVAHLVESAFQGLQGVHQVCVQTHPPNDLAVCVYMDQCDRTSRRRVAERERDVFRSLPECEIAFKVVG